MAPVIWGLDLAEIHWKKFKSSYMWNTDYHLRRTKFIVYQCALIFCVVSESLGTAALSDYIDEQKRIQKVDPSGYVYNNDYVGAASYNIFAGVFVAFIFGAAFFFDLFWPERHENRSVRIAWKACGILAVIFHLASAITITVITSTHSSYIRGVPNAHIQEYLLSQYKKAKEAPLTYRHNGRAVAAVVFAWPGFLSVLGSCILLFLSINHTEFGPGPKSKHARERDNLNAGDTESGALADEKEKSVADGESPTNSPQDTHPQESSGLATTDGAVESRPSAAEAAQPETMLPDSGAR